MPASPPSPPISHQAECGGLRRHILIYGTALISVMGVSSILPIIPELSRIFDLSEAAAGILIFSFTLPGIVLAPVGGILADRLGRKAVLLPCLCLFALGGFMASLAHSLHGFILWRMVQGCGAACLGVLYNAIIGDLFSKEYERLRIMGFAATALSLGAAIYPALGGLLGEVSWRWAVRLALLALPLVLVGLFTPLPDLGQRASMRDYARQMKGIVCSRRTLAHFGLTLCAFCILYGPMITYFPLFAHTEFAASPARIGILFAVSSLGTVLASALLGPLAQKLPARTLVMAGSVCFGLSMLYLLFLGTAFSNLYHLALPVLLYGLGQGLAYPTIMASLSALAPAEGRGVIMAVNGTVLRLAQSISPLFCGLFFAGAGFSAVFVSGVVLAALMLALGARTFKMPQGPDQH